MFALEEFRGGVDECLPPPGACEPTGEELAGDVVQRCGDRVQWSGLGRAGRDRDVLCAAAADLDAIKAIADAIDGTGKPFVGTSGTMLLARIKPGEVGTEQDVAAGGYRIDAENFVIRLADSGVRSSVIRLAPTVHSSLDRHGFVPALIGFARTNGFAAYVGDGANRWSAVHTLDAAHLYRLALENSPAGTRFHGVGDEGVPFKQIAETIGRHLDVPVRSIEPAAARGYFSYLTEFVQLDGVVSAARTREMLDWTPNHPDLIEDLNEGHYFRTTD